MFFLYIYIYICLFYFIFWGSREVVKKLDGGRRIRSVRVSAQTEPWRPDSCTGKIYDFDPVFLVAQQEDLPLVQQEDLLLQQEDLLFAQQEDLLVAHVEFVVFVQQDHLLVVQDSARRRSSLRKTRRSSCCG